ARPGGPPPGRRRRHRRARGPAPAVVPRLHRRDGRRPHAGRRLRTLTGARAPPPACATMCAVTYLPAPDRYESMPYRRCGRSGLLLPALSLGLWQNFGEDRPLETSRSIVLRAFDLGVTHFDLANNYGPPR